MLLSAHFPMNLFLGNSCIMYSDFPYRSTNPSAFNIKFYGYNDSSAATFFEIAEYVVIYFLSSFRYEYDESNGVSCVQLPQPVPSNALLLRGDYSTITVAVFGVPYFPTLQQPGMGIPNFSIPPPPIISCNPNFSVSPVMRSVGNIQTPSSSLAQVTSAQNWSSDSNVLPPAEKANLVEVPTVQDNTSGKNSSLEPPSNENNTNQVMPLNIQMFLVVMMDFILWFL